MGMGQVTKIQGKTLINPYPAGTNINYWVCD